MRYIGVATVATVALKERRKRLTMNPLNVGESDRDYGTNVSDKTSSEDGNTPPLPIGNLSKRTASHLADLVLTKTNTCYAARFIW